LAATYLIGKGMVDASIASFNEGRRFMVSVGRIVMDALEFVVGLFI